MQRLRGTAASPGAATAPAYVYRPDDYALPAEPDDDVETSVLRLAPALERVAAGLDEAATRTSGAAAGILRAQAALARDPALHATAVEAIRHGAHPAAAILAAGAQFARRLEETGNAYLAGRAPDLRHICDLAARELAGAPARRPPQPTEPCVLVADDLAPSDAIELEPSLVRAIVTESGTATCHTALIARSLQVPAVVGVRHLLQQVGAGLPMGVDGSAGTVYLDPDAGTVRDLETVAQQLVRQRAALRAAAGRGPAATADGHPVDVVANIRGVEDMRAALDGGAEGVGLLRTELLYLDRDQPPGEAEQITLLRDLHGMLGRGRLVVRTFDIGADKQVRFLPVRPEHNPELGVRGIRLAQQHPELLETQLRAVAATCSLGPTAVMAPMVATVAEASWFVERVRAAGVPPDVDIGVMVEVPALLFTVAELPREVSFLSVGTNDLTQYLHAADRRHAQLTDLLDPYLPAVLRAVDLLIRSAGGRRVGVCGEAASDPAWALLAVGMGVAELSMQPAALAAVRAALRGVALADCQDAAKQALESGSPAAARAIARELVPTVKE